MNTTTHSTARRVILAGISEERLDLFLLLNEGAGYEVAGVIDTRGSGESSRIAEILGVRVLTDASDGDLPDADLLIYGDDRFREMGARLHLEAENVWHENDAWRVLTEGEQTLHGENGDPAPPEDAVARAAGEWSDDAADDVMDDEPETEPAAVAEPPAPDEPAAPAETRPETPWIPAKAAPAAPPLGEPATEGPFALLHEFATASGDLESMYRWILERAIRMTGAAAGGVRPHEPVRPYVWRDRRVTPRGELPAFLKTEPGESGVTPVPLGGPETPGGGRLLLVAPSLGVRGELPAFLEAIAPALRTVAELDDHRRDRTWDEVIRRLASDLQETELIGDTIADACRNVAEALHARECVILFRSADNEVVRGYSSGGQRIVAPADSGLFGAGAGDRPRRFVDEEGLWHYHVPFARGVRRGAMGLFGVSTSPGTVEALGHQAVGLARAMADRFPEGAWQA